MEKKLKIFFLNIYQGDVLRGGERFVLKLSKRLSKNHEVRVISGNKKEIKRWPILWRLFIDPSGIRVCLFTLKNLPLILKEKPDIIIPLNGGWMSMWVRLTTWLYGGKVIVAGQSGIGWDDRINLCSFPNYFIALTNYAKKWAKKVNPLVRSEVISNGVDTSKFSSKGKKYSFKLSSPIVLCQGALTREKRIDLAIKAVSKLNNASLLLVGKGPEKEKLIKMGSRLMGDRFGQVQDIPFEKMSEVYRITDIFTFPTNPNESFGIAMVEAMATNLPVVANDDPIRKEIVGDAGLFVDPTDTKSYSKALKRALDTDWGDKPRKQAEKFDWNKIAIKYEKLFLSLNGF